MKRIVAHSFDSMEELSFNPETYSKMKYGCLKSSFQLGVELGKELAAWVVVNVRTGETVMISGAPYKEIPVASTALAKYAVMYLQSMFKDIHFKLFKIDREHSYHVDYGAMSAEEREKLIGSETFDCHADKLVGNHVIFIDDIVITGAHERNMDRMIDKNMLHDDCTSIHYAYYAELTNPECCPSVESDLNYAFIKKDGSNIGNFMTRTDWNDTSIILNTRLVKFLLSMPENDFAILMESVEVFKAAELYQLTLANNYEVVDEYVNNFKQLQTYIIDTYELS